MSAAWMAQQILSRANAPRSLHLDFPRYNPCPPGSIREGSCTDAVLNLLASQKTRFFTHSEIRYLTGKTGKGIDWALLFLRKLEKIEISSDEARNSRYLRYRFNSK